MADPVNIMILFTTMYSYVETAITTAVASFGSGLVSFVAAPLGVAATIYFLLLGFAVLRGAIQAPLRELVFQAGKIGFALAAASAVGYSAFVVNVVTDLPSDIISAGSGTPVTNPGTTFDTCVSDTGKLGQRMVDANTKIQAQPSQGIADFRTPLIQLTCSIITYGCIAILYIFAFLSAAIGFCIVIFAKLSVAICVALAPLALACLLFNSSRWLFDGWLRQTANYILLMVVMAIMTQFVTGLQEAAMDGMLGSIGDGSIFVTTQDTYLTLSAGVMIAATISCCAIYIVGSIFFFQSPSIASGIAGGASSGGHAFLQTGMNVVANRLLFRRMANRSYGLAGIGAAAGGAVTRSPLRDG